MALGVAAGESGYQAISSRTPARGLATDESLKSATSDRRLLRLLEEPPLCAAEASRTLDLQLLHSGNHGFFLAGFMLSRNPGFGAAIEQQHLLRARVLG